jgi:hypothetical protein
MNPLFKNFNIPGSGKKRGKFFDNIHILVLLGRILPQYEMVIDLAIYQRYYNTLKLHARLTACNLFQVLPYTVHKSCAKKGLIRDRWLYNCNIAIKFIHDEVHYEALPMHDFGDSNMNNYLFLFLDNPTLASIEAAKEKDQEI